MTEEKRDCTAGLDDYEAILDSVRMAGIYVIREDDHRILYYNKRVKDVAPQVRTGMVCHEMWPGMCGRCPLLSIDGKQVSRAVNYNNPFGKIVDVTATRIRWQDEIPAFVITVVPHYETANYTYDKILRCDLENGSFERVKVDEDFLKNRLSAQTLQGWFDQIVERNYIHPDDVERFVSFAQVGTMKEALDSGQKKLSCIYRRRLEDGYRWHIVEVIPEPDYMPGNSNAMLYIKDVHDVYRYGLEREEVNIRNQEIIRSLGEANFGIYVIDLPTGQTETLRASQEMQDIVQEEHFWGRIARSLAACCHPDSQEEFLSRYSLAAMCKCCEENQERSAMTLLCRIGNDYKYVSAAATFSKRRAGSGYAVLALQDVDDRIRRKMQQTENDRRMAAIIRSRYSVMSTLYLDTGLCDRVYLNNEDGVNGIGDYEHYFKRACREVVEEEDRERFERELSLDNLRRRASQAADYDELVVQYRIKNNPKIRWVEEHVMFVDQEHQRVVSILGRDITAEKEREEQQARDTKQRTLIVNSLSSMYFASYYVDFEEGTFQAVSQNEEVGRFLGECRNYMEGIAAYAHRFINPEDREEYLKVFHIEHLSEVLKAGKKVEAFEYRRIRPLEDGGYKEDGWVRASVVLADSENGRPKRAVYVAQDITEVKQREELEHRALQEACEAANHANASKTSFLSRMSHDIRTPMNAIIGMTAIAGTHLSEPDRVEDCLGKITVASKHLLSLINEVLDMSKIESGKIDLSEEEFSLSDLIQNLMTITRPSVQAKRHELKFHISKIDHEEVIGDPMRLQQVFTNILANSVKYTPEGGLLELEISERPSIHKGYGCYEFIFSDNGIGMSEEYLKRIFEPFSRADDPSVSRIEGTGLGMTIAQNIVRMMNGSIRVESKPGEGSRFTVTVFLKQQRQQVESFDEFRDLPVLVADDDEYACETACAVLGDIGMKGEWVLSGREAVERVTERHEQCRDYFAVILDWKMPDMDGIETAREIRRRVGPDVPIIILSAYDWSAVEVEARAAGIDGFISKPLFKSRLVYLFRQISEGDLARKESSPQKMPDEIPGNKRILLAEDNELNREIAVEIIGDMGVTVECAVNGKEALERFQEMPEHYYDLIFMDIQMPVMNGYEAARAIRSTERADALTVPIVAMTANAFSEDIIASRRAGMNEHITKPLNPDTLAECMYKWMVKEDAADE